MSASAAMTNKVPSKDPLLDALWDKGLILMGDRVRQEYALRTPLFIDLRHKLYDDLALLTAIGAALHRRIFEIVAQEEGEDRPQQVVGIPDTATPLALSTALASQGTAQPLGYGQLRKRPAAYPGGRSGTSSFMGTHNPTREITLIDDVMASGRTKLWSIDFLREDQLEVKRILVVVDREQGGSRLLEEKGYPVHSLYRISEVVEYYCSTGRVKAEVGEQALDHLRAKRFGER